MPAPHEWTVTDVIKLWDADLITIAEAREALGYVDEPPQPVTEKPAESQKFKVGDTVSIATVNDKLPLGSLVSHWYKVGPTEWVNPLGDEQPADLLVSPRTIKYLPE